MNGHQTFDSAGPRYTFEQTAGSDMDFDMHHPAYFSDQHMHNIQHQAAIGESSPTDYLNQYPNWPAMDITPHFTHQQNVSTHSFSSAISSFRSSNNSIFSQNPARDSYHSAVSVSSQSSLSKAQFISQTEQQLTFNSTAGLNYAPSSSEAPTSPAPRKRTAQHKIVQEKNPFKTCVSVTKQPRPCKKEQKYFCTACKRLFVEKADWKRHEETYQERPEMFKCDLCSAIYFLNKDFSSHHVTAHKCEACDENTRCSKKRHVQVAKKSRQLRTGWGCGFCTHFDSNWIERCNHIAMHIEKEGKTLTDWHHRRVIYSLLQRPVIHAEWEKIRSKRSAFIVCGWDEHSTGRIEGYPECNKKMQLQDKLEYYTPKDDATALAQLAYDKALKQPDPREMPVAQPTPPPKDWREEQTPSLPDFEFEPELWTYFDGRILEDDVSPTGVEYLEGSHV